MQNRELVTATMLDRNGMERLLKFYIKNIDNARKYIINKEDLDIYATGDLNGKAFHSIIMKIFCLSRDESREGLEVEELRGLLKDDINIDCIKVILNNVEKMKERGEGGTKEDYIRFIKLNMLRRYYNEGYDVSGFIVPIGESNEEAVDRFNSSSPRAISNYFQDKQNKIKNSYKEIVEFDVTKAGDGLSVQSMINSRDKSTEYGYNQCSEYVTSALEKGLCIGKVQLLSAGSSVGKSAYMISSCAKAASNKFYDVSEGKWKDNISGEAEGAVYISTEIDEQEFLQQLYSSIAGVDRSIWTMKLSDSEEKRIQRAEEVVRESNIHFVQCVDLNKRNLKDIVLKVKEFGVNYVFIDYIESNSAMIEEYVSGTKNAGAREDSALLDFMKFVKDIIAVKMRCAVMTGSQISGGNKYIEANSRNAAILANCKSLANKVDISMVMSCIPDEEWTAINEFNRGGIVRKPNRVITIFKLRAGRYNNVHIYGNFDLGTLRWHDVCASESVGGKKKGSTAFEHIFMPRTVIRQLDNGYKVPCMCGEEELKFFEATDDEGNPGKDMSFERKMFKLNRDHIKFIEDLPRREKTKDTFTEKDVEEINAAAEEEYVAEEVVIEEAKVVDTNETISSDRRGIVSGHVNEKREKREEEEEGEEAEEFWF